MSNLTKPVYNKLLRINSADRSPNSVSTSNFTVDYPNVLSSCKNREHSSETREFS